MQHAKNIGTVAVLLLLCHIGFSQQLRLGNNPYTVEKSAVLELQSNNQGLLFPRIADTLLINVLMPPNGMVIYFIPTGQLLVRSNGSWQSLVSASSLNNYWSVNGNSNGGMKKIGNIDKHDLPFITNNTERMRIDSTGKVGIGTTTPGSRLEIASGTANNSGLRFTNLNNSSPVTASSATLGVDAGGNVVVASSSSNVRANHILVKSASDFPAAVGGVITLVAGTTYEINGTITLTHKIDPNGCYLVGVNALTDKLVYTPASGELFTGNHGGTIKLLTLTAASAGAKLFNVDAAGANLNLIVQNCYILGCNNIGLIKGFGGTVYFETVAYFFNVNGITYENNTNLVLSTQLWDKTNSNTYEKLAGSFNIIQITGGDRTMQAVNSPVAIDVSGVTSLVTGELKMVLFNGTGTNVNGTFSNKWEVESFGLTTEKDDVATGNMYISTVATTAINTVNTPVKAAGTTTTTNLFRVTSPATNRLTYTGTKTKRFLVIGSLTATMSTTLFAAYYTFYIAKNGTVLPESKQKVRIANSADQVSISLSCTVSLSTNDYIEVWVENNSDATDIALQNLNLAIK